MHSPNQADSEAGKGRKMAEWYLIAQGCMVIRGKTTSGRFWAPTSAGLRKQYPGHLARGAGEKEEGGAPGRFPRIWGPSLRTPWTPTVSHTNND